MNIFRIIKSKKHYWEFTRPHTMLGTSITVIAIFLITINNFMSISIKDVTIVIFTLLSSLLANIFIVGINQIYDVEIDQINKPYLPIASGNLSISHAKYCVYISCIFSIIISGLVSLYLILVVILGMVIGTFYSIPQTRFKSNPFLAALSISFVRGVLGNIGLYLSYKSVISGRRQNVDSIILFLTIFILIYALVIAIFKDIPDIAGDKKFNILTFSVRLGSKRMFLISIILVFSNYIFAIISGFLISEGWNQFLDVSLHIIIALAFLYLSQKTYCDQKQNFNKYYKKIRSFIYLEYILILIKVLL